MVLGIKDEASIFENVLKYENAVTELLRNFMRYRLFRNAFLAFIGVEKKYLSTVLYQHFQTQKKPEGMKGIPDLWIENEDLAIFVEIKTTPWRKLTYDQQNEYLEYLEKNCKKQFRSYILLSPEHYQYWDLWKKSVKSDNKVNCNFISWKNIYDLFGELDLGDINGIIREWLIYLRTNLMIPDLSLTEGECKMLFNKETGKAMQNIMKIIGFVEQELNKSYLIEKSRKIEHEIGFYVLSKNGEYGLWFGVWFDAWAKYGMPLCFGVDKNWNDKDTTAFKEEYKGEYIEEELDGYWIVPISEKVLRNNKDDKSSVVVKIIEILKKALRCVEPLSKQT